MHKIAGEYELSKGYDFRPYKIDDNNEQEYLNLFKNVYSKELYEIEEFENAVKQLSSHLEAVSRRWYRFFKLNNKGKVQAALKVARNKLDIRT